ncbi:MAG TPA: hypothetical protein VFP58_07820 [Candidatus Eisenbacteria bacterium]|nr:hypothetical protein [Candidatus Eisenbacteria bacterium]
MPFENFLPTLDEAAWTTSPTSTAIDVTYDEESNEVIFREEETGRLVHAWVADRRDALAVAGLFQAVASKPWGTQETIQGTASVLLAILGTAPGQVTLHDELASILRAHGNRWMTTAELAAEVNRRGRHWKANRNRITAAKVLGRVKLYARTFERIGERVRLLSE